MEKSCAIYLRVSTEEQSPENQRADVQRYAEALGYKIVEEYIEKESGAYSERKELQRMLSDAVAGKFKVVFIWALDRLSREGIEETLIYIKQLRKAGVSLKSFQEQWLDTSDEGIGELITAIFSWVAKQERKKIMERSMTGKKERLRNGKLIGCYPPYGYNHIKRDKVENTDARFEINLSEALIVKRIFKLYLEFESIFLLGKTLMKAGIKTRGRGGTPKFFGVSSLKKILSNETYIGNWYYGKASLRIAKFHIKKNPKHKLTGRTSNPKSEWFLVKVPAIIDEKTFQRVQEIMKKRFKKRENEKLPALCRGLIRCVDCGLLYSANLYKYSKHAKGGERKYFMYRCPQKHSVSFNKPPCHSRSIMVHKLDKIIWDYISIFIKDRGRVKERIRLLREKREKEKDSNKKSINDLLGEKERFKAQINKLLDLYGEDQIPRDEIRAKIEEIKEKELVLDGQIGEIHKELIGAEKAGAIEEEVEKLCVLYENKISNLSFENKRKIVKKWVKEINLLKDGKIVIKTTIPQEEVFERLSGCGLLIHVTQRGQEIKKSYDAKRLSEALQENSKEV